MRYCLIIFACVFAGIISSCKKNQLIMAAPVNDSGTTVTIKQSVGKFINGETIKISFDSLLSDSRCPKNAECIWAGTVVSKFSFTKNSSTTSFVLSTLRLAGIYESDTTISGYKIKFVNLIPYPQLFTPPYPADQIKAELLITH